MYTQINPIPVLVVMDCSARLIKPQVFQSYTAIILYLWFQQILVGCVNNLLSGLFNLFSFAFIHLIILFLTVIPIFRRI